MLRQLFTVYAPVSSNSHKQQTRNSAIRSLRYKVIYVIFMLITSHSLSAQTTSGGWDAAGTNGTTGFTNWGSGVIQLLGTTNTGCAGAAVHETSSTYDPTSGVVFSKCYQVYFGCPGNDNIGSDINGDGMAFSFSKCGYNINNGTACGGGLGYMGACPQMLTIEFDTWSSQGNSGFDAAYGGGTAGDHDEIALQRDGNASDAGRITSVDAGNLEDGLEHAVCISYTPATHILAVTIDGNLTFSYNLTGSPYDLPTYFGAGGLNQTWSSGKAGATNPATVSDGSGISATVGGPLCPASVVITSPLDGTVYDLCDGPMSITASASAPASNTVSFIEFFVDGVSIGTDLTAPYDITWNPVTDVHALTAIAHFTPSNTTATSAVNQVTISPGIQETFTAPAIDGLAEPVWSNYGASTLTKLPVGTITGPTDLSATFQTMRDANNLYIFVSVTDDVIMNSGVNPWDKDGVEIFIDMGNDKNTTYGTNDFQYSFVTGPTTITEYKHNAVAGVVYAEGPKAGGYTIEISIPWTTLGGAPAPGDLMGFDVHVNDDDNDGVRDSKIAWHDNLDIAFHDPSGFGTIKISPCTPCPTAALSGDNSICNDGISTADLTIDFTGTSPWTFEYAIDGVTQPAITGITTTPYVFDSNTGAHVYTLVSVSNPYSTACVNNTSGTATITVKNLPVGHDTIFTVPGAATLHVVDQGGTYQWYDVPVGGTVLSTGPQYITPILTDTTVYYVEEASAAPCRLAITAFPVKPPVDFFIPNLITPNNDGQNDAFAITGLPENSLLTVYNRWGELVYKNNNYDNLWAGSTVSDGVYYFDLTLPDGQYYKGWLHVVR